MPMHHEYMDAIKGEMAEVKMKGTRPRVSRPALGLSSILPKAIPGPALGYCTNGLGPTAKKIRPFPKALLGTGAVN